jgi:drug/metabolite transporter (DMT)-like permease
MTGMYSLFIAAVLLDTLGTTLFKLGASHAAQLETSLAQGFGFKALQSFFSSWYIPFGLAVYVVEYVIWITYLSSSSLSRAFPMYSLTIVLILIVSKFVLKEKVGLNRWLGALLIIAGVLMLGGSE